MECCASIQEEQARELMLDSQLQTINRTEWWIEQELTSHEYEPRIFFRPPGNSGSSFYKART